MFNIIAERLLKIILFISILLIINSSLASVSYAQNKDDISIEVGLLSIYTKDKVLDTISVTLEQVLKHYFDDNRKIISHSLTKKYNKVLDIKDEKTNELIISKVIDIAKKENLRAIILIDTSTTITNSVISNNSVIKPYDTQESDKIVYSNTFNIDKEALFNSIPPRNIIKAVPYIINSVLSVNITIKTNAPKSSIYMDDRFITYAEPSVTLEANIGTYIIKIKAEGYNTLEKKIEIRRNGVFSFNLNESMYDSTGLSLQGAFIITYDLFPDYREINRLSTSYSLQYYFYIFNYSRICLDFNLAIINVTRLNKALILNESFDSRIYINSTIFLFNILYEPVFDFFPWINPIAGIGIGIVAHTTRPRTTRSSDICYDAIGGISININRTFSIIAEYRYIWLGELRFIEIEEIYPVSGYDLNVIDSYYKGSLIFLGLRINL
ncbi:MAG: PEGA domain-containing protein [Spirochaetota bacterium]